MDKSAKIDKIETRKKIETSSNSANKTTGDANSTGAIQKKRSSIKTIKSSSSMKSSDYGKKSLTFLFSSVSDSFFWPRTTFEFVEAQKFPFGKIRTFAQCQKPQRFGRMCFNAKSPAVCDEITSSTSDKVSQTPSNVDIDKKKMFSLFF
jgi:hypothetical protein